MFTIILSRQHDAATGSSKLAYILAMGFNEPLGEGAMCREQLVKDCAVSA